MGATGTILGGLPTAALASNGDHDDDSPGGGGRTIATGPLDFEIYSSLLGADPDGDPNTPSEFGYPDAPMFRFHDHSGTAFFDPSQIRMTPTGTTLHHALRFFNGWLIDRRPKPYTLVHGEDGRYTERGQTMNFTAQSEADLEETLRALAATNGALAKEVFDRLVTAPLFAIAGERWRAVGNDVVQLVAKGDPRPRHALTRVDFYSRGGGKPELSQSLLYVIWPRPSASADEFDPGPMPPGAVEEARQLITSGPANLGGQ